MFYLRVLFILYLVIYLLLFQFSSYRVAPRSDVGGGVHDPLTELLLVYRNRHRGRESSHYAYVHIFTGMSESPLNNVCAMIIGDICFIMLNCNWAASLYRIECDGIII